MNNQTVLPESVHAPHLVAFDLMVKKRLSSLELDSVLIYLIDTVNEGALIYLAQQFDLMGYKGWKLADTTSKKRELIRNAIELHRYKGTVYAIRKALNSIGYPDVKISEHVSHWAGFSINLNIGDNPINEEQTAEVVEMIKEYKNVRSHLMGIVFEVTETEGISITDSSFEAGGDEENDGLSVGGDFRYNGEYLYNGEKNYSSDSDILEINIS